MTVETASYVNQLDYAKPGGSDSKGEGDDHIRLIKTALVTCFPNVGGVASASHTELSTLVGAASTGTTTLRVATRTAGDSGTHPASTAFVADAISTATLATTSPLTYMALMAQGVV